MLFVFLLLLLVVVVVIVIVVIVDLLLLFVFSFFIFSSFGIEGPSLFNRLYGLVRLCTYSGRRLVGIPEGSQGST